MSGAPKQEPLSPEARDAAFRLRVLLALTRETTIPMRDLELAADVVTQAYAAHESAALARADRLVAQIQRKDEALKAAQHCIDQNLPHAEDVEAQIAEALKGDGRG